MQQYRIGEQKGDIQVARCSVNMDILILQGGERHEGEDMGGFVGQAWKWYTPYLLSSHKLEFSHMASLNSRKKWQM